MTEELKIDNGGGVKIPPRELNEFELEQFEKGWNPDGPKSAQQWVDDGSLYKEIKNRGKEIKQLKKTVEQLVEHMQKQEHSAYKKALEELNSQREQAIRQGDVEMVKQYDKELKELPSVPPEKHEAVQEFENMHSSWLNDTSFEAMEMQDWIYDRDKKLLAKKLPVEEHMRLLDEYVRKKFPDYFNTEGGGAEEEKIAVAPENVPRVESNYSSYAPKVKNKKYTFNDLNETQKEIAKNFERLGVMSKEKYIAQLVELGEIK